MVNDEDGESDDEDDDKFKGESTSSDGLESTESDVLENSHSDEFVINEDQIFDSNPGDDDKWERVYEGRFCELEDNVNYNKAIESLHKESPVACTWAMLSTSNTQHSKMGMNAHTSFETKNTGLLENGEAQYSAICLNTVLKSEYHKTTMTTAHCAWMNSNDVKMYIALYDGKRKFF
ncbi:hypothetical protein Cgig2_014225 [Carnegiea gigantea]|uniref:Uncharacterized protein n=1 Tax=Carnegiea gigantea TaxID=171969 RepID=A0A9Q1K092_9CARY|nr:hypothetical protein Cgig2_014225 [Carnegiea gigantea]